MSKKKEEQLAQAQKTAEAARQAAAPQSGYSTADLNSRSDVQNALAGACLLYTSPSPRDS